MTRRRGIDLEPVPRERWGVAGGLVAGGALAALLILAGWTLAYC